ncbi:response regulator [Lachnospiraceae bacterium 45-W7]
MARILIVEDNADTNEAVFEYLQEVGHEIKSAYDGVEALELFSQNTIDLIILDIMLPTMSGLAVLNAVPGQARCLLSCLPR